MPTNPPFNYRRRRPSRIGKDRSSLRPSRYPRGHDRSKKRGGDREKEKESQNGSGASWERLFGCCTLRLAKAARTRKRTELVWRGWLARRMAIRCLSSSRSCASLAQSGNTTNSNRVWCSFDQLDHVVSLCITVVGLIIIDGLNSLCGLITIFRLLYKPWDISENLNSIII